jgi:ribonuclease III
MTATGHDTFSPLYARLQYPFRDPTLLTLALTHRSYCAEHPGTDSNERLEFLGDAVLGLAITDHLYRRQPGLDEGDLAKIRSAVVSAGALAAAAEAIGLGTSLRLGRGELLSGGRLKQSILADAFEAVIGAAYVDGGYTASAEIVVRLLGAQLDLASNGPGDDDYKTRLQELAARQFDRGPTYVLTESGPDHGKQFYATVVIGEERLGSGMGTSKKRAEQAAARAAWQALTGGDEDVGAARS